MTNDSRAERARDAIQLVAWHHYDMMASPREVMIDLLADMMHMCNEDGEDFDDALVMAEIHYNTEKDSGNE